MSIFKEEITLENIIDRGLAARGYIKDGEIRTLTVRAMPDTGAWTLVINEDTRQKLGLSIAETSESTLADGKTDTYCVTEGVKIQWKNRSTVLPAVVVPDAKDILLGALPLEAMDLMVDPVHERLVGVHGDQPLHVLYSVKKNRRGNLDCRCETINIQQRGRAMRCAHYHPRLTSRYRSTRADPLSTANTNQILHNLARFWSITAVHAAIVPSKPKRGRKQALFCFLCGLTSETPCVASFPEYSLGGKRDFGTIFKTVNAAAVTTLPFSAVCFISIAPLENMRAFLVINHPKIISWGKLF